MIVIEILMVISILVIFFAMVGYPLLLLVLDKVIKAPKNKTIDNFEPSVTYMIVAHNEEDVIVSKLENALQIDYPSDKFDILVASDNSTDSTNELVDNFIQLHRDHQIRLVQSKEHLGKTNAQNEAQKTVNSEILVMTDANTMVEPDAVRQLISYFSADNIVYVCGRLVYSNTKNDTSESEATYWNLDMKMRDIESRLQTITAGNGALYACRNSEYKDFEPIQCHDSSMPLEYALNRKRSLFNPDAVAYEKAGENNKDEFKRKVRMNRIILNMLKNGFKTMNFFKYKWFSLFYFGHRFCRYLIWLMHVVFFLCSIVLIILGKVKTGTILVILQLFALFLGIWSIHHSISNRWLRLLGYYVMTVLAQLVAVYNQLSGKSSSTWTKASSTR